MTELVLKKWGNSLAARIPAAIVKTLKIGVDQKVEIEAEDGKIILTPIKEMEYNLDELLGQCSEDQFALDDEDRAWVEAQPVGKEIW